jgi:hypothetical protein
MDLKVWRYVCVGCEHSYSLPNADLSFSYGVFLARSASGEVAIYESFADPFFQETSTIVQSDSRAARLPMSEIVELVQEVMAIIFDPDSNGRPFVIVGSPGCPQCGSRGVSDFMETDEVFGCVEISVTQVTWSAFSEEERRARVIEELDRQLGDP